MTDGAGVAIRGTVCRSTLSSFQILLEGKALSKATTSIKYSHRFEMQLCKAVRVVMFNEASPVVFACEQLRSPMIFIVQFPAVQMIYHFVCELNRNRQTKQTPGTHCVPDRSKSNKKFLRNASILCPGVCDGEIWEYESYKDVNFLLLLL